MWKDNQYDIHILNIVLLVIKYGPFFSTFLVVEKRSLGSTCISILNFENTLKKKN